MIVADLAYEYVSGKEKTFGQNSSISPEKNLFVINKELYRPDSVHFEYYEDSQVVRNITINELWLTDPKLPSGQQSTGGQMRLVYERNGDLADLYLNLNNQQCQFEKVLKKIYDIVLVEVLTDEEVSPPSTLIPTQRASKGEKVYRLKMRLKPGITKDEDITNLVNQKNLEQSVNTGYLLSDLEKILNLPEGYLYQDNPRRLTYNTQDGHQINLNIDKFNRDYFLFTDLSIDTDKKYENKYFEMIVVEENPSLIHFIKNRSYCLADDDCFIRYDFCKKGAFNKYHLFRDVWGCGPNIDENGCEIETKFQEAKCINNQCVGIGKEEIKKCNKENS